MTIALPILYIALILLGVDFEWEHCVLHGILITLFIFFLLWLIIMLACVHDFRINEFGAYNEMIAKHDTLEAILNNSTDIINTDLYKAAIEYNQKVARIAAQLDNPHYSIYYKTATCPWADLPIITIGQS